MELFLWYTWSCPTYLPNDKLPDIVMYNFPVPFQINQMLSHHKLMCSQNHMKCSNCTKHASVIHVYNLNLFYSTMYKQDCLYIHMHISCPFICVVDHHIHAVHCLLIHQTNNIVRTRKS